MRFIDIGNPNVLINPEQISYIEQRIVGITTVSYVCIGGKDFMVGIPLDELWDKLGIGQGVETKQEFGG